MPEGRQMELPDLKAMVYDAEQVVAQTYVALINMLLTQAQKIEALTKELEALKKPE